MINKQLNQIELQDIENLIQNSVSEGTTIEYKLKLPDGGDSAKKEFLKDVSSFANTSGGDLIFGVEEEKGLPKKIEGVLISNIDEEILKYENIIQYGIEPRIRPEIHTIKCGDGKYILVIRMKRSWIGPHRVIFNKCYEFYARNSRGKYPLDTMQLRTAFNLSDTLIDKINKFRVERIAAVVANDTPVPFNEGAKIILHLIPLESFSPNTKFDVIPYENNGGKLKPIYCFGKGYRINLEGVLAYSDKIKKDIYSSYVQLYRNGIIEAVEGLMLNVHRDKLAIPREYEQELLKSFLGYLNILSELAVNPPIIVFLTLTGVKGYEIASDSTTPWNKSNKIDRDILMLPESMIENYEVTPQEVLRPMFDLVWNACGYTRLILTKTVIG